MFDRTFEWFAPIWKFLHHKQLVPIFLTVVILVQFKTGYFRSFKKYFPSLKYSSKQLLYFFGFSVLIFKIAFFTDPWVTSWARNSSGIIAECVWSYGTEMGRSIWIFLAFFYLIFSAHSKFRGIVFGALLGTSLTGLCATILKWISLRARPDVGEGHLSFFNWQHIGTDNRDFQSFPSGDVAIVAGACFFLMLVFRRKRWLSVLFLLTPFATAFARMHWHRHWFSDTVTSMILGLGWSFFLYGYERFQTGSSNNFKQKLTAGG